MSGDDLPIFMSHKIASQDTSTMTRLMKALRLTSSVNILLGVVIVFIQMLKLK